MADIYDMNAAIDKPQWANAFAQGRMTGQQMKQNALALEQAQMQQADRNALRTLAPQIVAGDIPAYLQAAAINPEAAGKYQTAADAPYAKLRNMVTYIDRAKATGNQAALQAALGQAWPYIRQVAPGAPEQPPSAFTPEMEQGWEALKAKVAMAGQAGEMPTGFRQFQMTAEAAGLVPGTPEYQQAANIALGREGRASNAGFGFELTEGADGRKRLQRRNPRSGAVEVYDESTGDFVPVGGMAAVGGAPAPAPAAGGGMQQEPVAALATINGAPIPPEEMAAYQRALEADARGEAYNIQIPPGGAPTVRTGADPSLVVSRRPEDEAAATEAAKRQVELTTLPTELAMQTQDAVKRASGVTTAQEAAKRQADLATAATKKYVDATTTLGLLDEADALLDKSTGSLIGAIGDQAAAAFGRSTEGAQAIASLQPIAASLTLAVPRMEGPQSDADRLLYQKAAGDFANPNVPVATRKAASAQMRRLALKYKSGVDGRSGTRDSGSAIRRARNPQTGEVLELRNGAWVPAQ